MCDWLTAVPAARNRPSVSNGAWLTGTRLTARKDLFDAQAQHAQAMRRRGGPGRRLRHRRPRRRERGPGRAGPGPALGAACPAFPAASGTALPAAAAGARLWVARYSGPGNGEDEALSVAVSPGGARVFVTGYSQGAGSGHDYATVAYSAATGARLWARRYNGPGNGDDQASSVAVSPGGARVFVTGTSEGVGHSAFGYATVAYDAATGAQLWVRRYNGPGNGSSAAFSVAVSPGGTRVFVTGSSQGTGSGQDSATVAYSAATGAQLWAQRYNGPANGGDYAVSVAVSPGGTRVFVTGGSQGSGSHYDYATVAYNAATGARLWAQRYNGPANGDDQASSLAVSPGGTRVFVTGGSQGARSGQDYATVAYSAATGARLWAQRYNGPANGGDQASSLAVSPGGTRVFVTGTSQGARWARTTPRWPTAPPPAPGCGCGGTTARSTAATAPARWRSARRHPGVRDRHQPGRGLGLRPGLRHGGLQRRHRRPAVGAAVQRPGQQHRPRHLAGGQSRRHPGVRDRDERWREGHGI